MTALKAGDVQRFVERPDLKAGVFLIYGPDAGLVREMSRVLSASLAGGELVEIIALDGAGDPGQLALEARSGSLFGDRRIIRLRDAGKGFAPVLTAILADPGDAIVIVEADTLAPRDAVRAAVEASKAGRALPCYADSGKALERVIRDRFAQAEIAADPDAIATLQDLLGNDREITRSELEKLVLFAGDTGRITRADVLLLCADNGALAVDEVLDAAGTGHADNLETALARALRGGTEIQFLLAMMLNHLRFLRRLRVEVDRGQSPADAIRNARPRPHFSREATMTQQLRLWRDDMLSRGTQRVLAATAESRKTPALAEVTLRRTLHAICQTAAQA